MAENSTENRLLKILVLCILAISVVFGLKSYTVDSEFWSVTLAQYFFQPGSFHYAVYNKPLFYFLLDLIYFFPMSSLTHVLVAKTLFVGNALFLSFFAFRIFQSLSRSTTAAWIGMIFLITNPVWFAEAFRIRSDLLAMTLTLAAVSIGLRSGTSLFHSKTMVTLFVASFLATPKSALWNVPLVLYFIPWAEVRLWFAGRKWVLSKSYLTFLGVMALVALVFSLEFVRVAYGIAWSHSLASFQRASALGPTPWMVDWFFVIDAVKASPGYSLLMALSFILCPFVVWRGGRKDFAGFLVALVAIAAIFIGYSPKLYFFIATYIPLFMIPFVLLIALLLRKAPANLIRSAVVLPIFSFVVWTRFLFPMHEGASTYQFITDVDKYVSGKPLKIFDSMGLLPRGNNFLFYISEADEAGNKAAFESVFEKKPEFIFETMRIAAFFPKLKTQLLERDYVEIEKSIWLKHSALDFYTGYVSDVENPPELFGQRLLCVAQSATPYMRWDFSGLNCF